MLNKKLREKLIEQFIKFIENRDHLVLGSDHVIKNLMPPVVLQEINQVLQSESYLSSQRDEIRKILYAEIPKIAVRVKEHLEAEQPQEYSEEEKWWLSQPLGGPPQD